MEQFVVTTIRLSVPLIFAGLGGLFSVRAGIFHIGIEGLMLAGAFVTVGFGSAVESVWLGMLGAIAVNLLLSAIYWFLIDRLKADMIIAGLGLTTLCVGGAAFLMNAIFNKRGSMTSLVRLPQPVVGPQEGLLAYVSELSILAWMLPIFALIVWVVLRRSRFGLQIAAVGEYPYASEAAGVDISRTKLYAMLITGLCCALAGSELAVGGLAAFSENMTNGRGFIALAAILFGSLEPIRTALAGLFFGLANAVGINSQIYAGESNIPRQFILMIPFVATIFFVTLRGIISQRRISHGN